MSPREVFARWERLPPRSRRALSLGVVAVVVAAVLALGFGRDARVSLFANALKPDQLAEVDAQLSAWNVPFVPTADNIRLDRRRRGGVLARLALAGVPHAHVVGTAEALASIGTLTPQAILDAQARTGLEGDLGKGLRGLGGIADARVIIAPARGGIFADEPPTPASASVRLTAAPGAVISTSTLAAVKAFVAAGVPGLRGERVTVVDDRGTLADEAADEARAREAALQSALDTAFGSDTTIVRLHVERDERARESRDVRRVPEGPALARNDLNERFKAEKRSYVRSQRLEERGTVEHEERTIVSAGGVARLSIAIIVDARRGLDLAKIRDVAAAAAGLEPARGDTLSVDAVPFERVRPAARPLRSALLSLVDVLPPLAFAAVALVVLRAAAGPAGAFAAEAMRRRHLERVVPAGGLSARAIFDALRDEPPHTAAAVIARLGTPLATEVLDLYGSEQRHAIVARLARRVSPLVPDADAVVRGG